MSVFTTNFPAGPMGITIKPSKLYLSNGTKLIVLQVTDVVNCTNPAVQLGDFIGTINGNPFVGREGTTSFAKFYETALNWLRQHATEAKSLKMFHTQEARISDGTATFPPMILSLGDSEVWMGKPAPAPTQPPPLPPSYQEQVVQPQQQTQVATTTNGAQWYQIPFPAGQPLGLGLEPLKIILSSGMQLCVLQVISTSNPNIHQGDIVGMVNGTALAGGAGVPFR